MWGTFFSSDEKDFVEALLKAENRALIREGLLTITGLQFGNGPFGMGKGINCFQDRASYIYEGSAVPNLVLKCHSLIKSGAY